MKRYRFTLAALLVFLALLAWVFTQERGRVPEEGEIFRLGPEQISKLEITGDDDKIVLERRGERWHLTAPITGLVDPDKAQALLDALVRLKPNKREGADVTRADYGLQEPALTVTFHTNTGQATTVKLGAKTGVGSEHFATITGRPELYLVSSSFQSAMDKSADEIRDKQAVRVDQADVRRVKIERPGQTIVAERVTVGDEDVWYLRQPLDTPADRFAVQGILDAVTRAKAAEFAEKPADPSTVGLDKPQAVATLTTKDGQEITLRVGKEIEKEVATESGEGTETRRVVYVEADEHPQLLLVYADLADDLNKDVMDLRDKTILSFANNDVTAVKVQSKSAANFEAHKNKDGQWMLQAPAGVEADRGEIDSILWSLDDLSATAFEEEEPQDLQKYGLTVPEAVITLTIRGQSQPVKVTFGKPADPGARYCRTSQSTQVYQVGDIIVKGLPASLEELTESSDDYPGEYPPEVRR